MTSLTSVLTFFILVLFNGYLTVPVVDQQLLTATFSSINNELTSPVVDSTITPLVVIGNQQSLRHYSGLDVLESSTNTLKRDQIDQLSTNEKDQPLSTPLTTDLFERTYNDETSTTIETSTDTLSYIPRALKNDLESSTQIETVKKQILTESTVDKISSTLSPKVQGLSSSTVSKTKYVGLLKYDSEEDENAKNNYDGQTQPQTNKDKYSDENEDSYDRSTVTKKSKIRKDDQLQEDTTVPVAVFDQQALSQLSYVPNDVLVLDENDSVIVTDRTKQFSTTTILSSIQTKPLNQGEESLYSEEKESNN